MPLYVQFVKRHGCGAEPRLEGFFRFQWQTGQESDVAAAMLPDRGPFRMVDGDPEAMTLPSATKAI